MTLEHVTHHPEPTSTVTFVDLLDAALVQADQQRAALVAADDLDGLAHGLSQLRTLQRKLSMLESQTTANVAELIRDSGEQRAEIPGLGVAEVHRRSLKTRWESDRIFGRLIDAIADHALVDPDTGEIDGDQDTAERMAHLCRDILGSTLPMTPSLGWRVRALREQGIDPNTYRTQERGPDTVRIIGPEELQ